jgi:integrase
MPALAANVRVIEKAIKGRAAVYAITGHDGLYLDVRGEGRATWRLRYRPKPKANQRWLRLANHATADQFTAVAAQALALMTDLRLKGIDPAENRPAEPEVLPAPATAPTIAECYGLWIDHTGKRRQRPLAPDTRKSYAGLFKLHVAPHFGATPIDRLDRAKIQAKLQIIRANTSDAEKGQRGLQAKKVLTMLTSICEWAIDQELIERNPCRGVADPVPLHNPDGKQHRPPTDAELRQLWLAAPKVLTPAQTRVLKFAILTGRRISEIVGICPKEVQTADSIPYLFIPANRTGNKAKQDDAMPLAPMALDLLQEALIGAEPAQPLFVGAASRWTTSKSLTLLRRSWGWPEPPVRFHDFRSLINGQMAKLRIPSELRSRTLHHTGDIRELVNTVYSAYDHMPDRLKALELWEARLREIVADQPPSGLVWS